MILLCQLSFTLLYCFGWSVRAFFCPAALWHKVLTITSLNTQTLQTDPRLLQRIWVRPQPYEGPGSRVGNISEPLHYTVPPYTQTLLIYAIYYILYMPTLTPFEAPQLMECLGYSTHQMSTPTLHDIHHSNAADAASDISALGLKSDSTSDALDALCSRRCEPDHPRESEDPSIPVTIQDGWILCLSLQASLRGLKVCRVDVDLPRMGWITCTILFWGIRGILHYMTMNR